MAEARSEEDEENMRESREQVVRRQQNNSSSAGRSDRRKPEHRHSQGPLSSIRAAIKRTSNRSTSLSETPPRDRDRDRDRERDRRRPEITILSAEPLSSWFPGAGFPPPPPPSAQIWGPTIAPSVQELQPPPSYEEVIREKNQEQLVVPAASPRPPSLSSSQTPSVSTTTIATQTDTGAGPQTQTQTQVRRPSRPPRPSLPFPPTKPLNPDVASDRSPPRFPDSDAAAASISTQTPPPEPVTDQSEAAPQRPRPRPRSKVNLQPIRDEVKVQTLVKLREDGLRTLAARAQANGQVSHQDSAVGGRYLQELLEAFSSDDWGFPEQRSASQSESEDDPNQEVVEEDDEDMATLRARIQAFEQMHDGNPGDQATIESKPRPEPKPRPRLPQNKPPTVAPKPKNISSSASLKDCRGLMDDPGCGTEETEQTETPGKPPIASKPAINVTDVNAAPVPVARASSSTPPAQPKLPPRPSIAPRTTPPRPAPGQTTPQLPPRPAVDVRTRGNKTEAAGSEESAAKTVKAGGPRPSVPSKPAAVTRRSSAPNLVPHASPSPESSPAPCRPSGPPRPGPAPALRKSTSVQSPDPPLPPRPTGVKLLPLRPPPIKSLPGRPPPPSVTSNSNPPPPLNKSPSSPSLLNMTSPPANQEPGQRASKKGPPLPPRPKPGHPLYNSSEKQEVLIVLDDPSPAPSEFSSQSDNSSAPVPPSVQSLLDLDLNLGPIQDQDHNQTKPALEELTQTQNILSVEPIDQKKEPEPSTISGPSCVALFDFEAALDDELAFSRGDVIALLELIGGDEDWGRGQLRGRTGLFPLNFTRILEPLPTAPPNGDMTKTTAAKTEPASSKHQDAETEEWAVAAFDFPGQTADDLSFQKGALIRVLEHVDDEWRRGRVELREGLYPAAFTQTCTAQPITEQRSELRAKALFDFAAENEDELTLKVGDVLTEVESMDEQWIVGVVGGKRGIVPKNYISLLT